MDDLERRLLESLRINWAPTPEDVWAPPAAHVDGLHDRTLRTVMDAFADAEASDGSSPLGVAVTGQHGSGKTHMLSVIRVEVQRRGGYFFLVSLLHGKDFWQNITHALRTGLYRPGPDGERQLAVVLRRLADCLDLPDEIREQVTGQRMPTRQGLFQLAAALDDHDMLWGHECRNTVKAMALLVAPDPMAREIGESYLMSGSETQPGERAEWGIQPDTRPAQQMVGEISRLLSLTGPSLLAVDQIDTLMAQSTQATDLGVVSPVSQPDDHLLEGLGVGLMDLRQTTHRTVTVVACQPHVWQRIGSHTNITVKERFRQESRLNNVPSVAVGQALVETRFRSLFAEADFDPEYPSWPVRPSAFAAAPHFTPRELFKRIDDHVRSCLDTGVFRELTNLLEESPPPAERVCAPAPALNTVAAAYADLLANADPTAAVQQRTEDERMPALLAAGLRSYMYEQGKYRDRYSLDPPPGDNPSLHARLRYMVDEQTGDQMHWSFRAISSSNHLNAQNRIERLQINAGLDPDVPKRRAYLLRTGGWSMGTPKTKRMLANFKSAGGVLIDPVSAEDLRVFAALERMWEKPGADLWVWLEQHKPASQTTLFRQVFGEPDLSTQQQPEPVVPEPSQQAVWPDMDPDSVAPPTDTGSTIPLGTSVDTGRPLMVGLESLRKHTAIFAGSGSGKTVLIRRLVEECALRGVSSIVLDPNNDLARLGDAWPQAPDGWQDEDAARSVEYRDGTDVVIWTPRREAGRPLTFQPLPDLSAVVGDPDEFSLALDTAVAALAPRARADGSTAKAERARAVLREALAWFARKGGTRLHAFLNLLADLPDDITTLSKAHDMAADMAQTLMAARINDPLFGGTGEPLDPGVLLTPPPGKHARVSVISLIGLPTDQQRQNFVNQLQMALFAWIKQNPAGDRPLGGLLVMDEAQTLAPSGMMTASTASTLALASQARKYGLGLVFATQAPKGIHNRIVGNAATQYFGFINSPVQVAAAREMAAAKGSAVLDISRLNAGEFYVVAEGRPFQKVIVPMCLSHHPSSALTSEEVLSRARATG
ncbi:helicase HerA domain-containing protein [Kibdelosporangium persicum]|uniref:DNA helicase HerA n=1 Tax=Kibdelosporangium persicum TaxID=2698649 RepID=A0ABX2FGD5_9PSEU|nr:DUF87 domain-containing protein [Kibdelosporangium persicum]NRN70184.1 DNA helicase HerA [Kibdelosporangium persicum]